MTRWLSGKSKAGKIQTKAFSGILKAIYPSQISTGTGMLRLDFEDGSNIGIFGTDKAEIIDDEVNVGGSLADFCESLKALDWDYQWGLGDGDELLGFHAEKDGIDLIGSKLWLEPLDDITIEDDTQTKKSVFWGIVTKIESAPETKAQQQPAKNKPGKLPPEPKIVDNPKPTPKSDISAQILNALETQSMSYGELYLYFGKKHKISEIREAIADLGEAVTENNKKWEVA